MRHKFGILFAVAAMITLSISACSTSRADSYDPEAIAAKYGVTGAYVDKITTEEGLVDATIVPTTLADGSHAQLVIPHRSIDAEHQVFMRDGVSMTPIELENPSVDREDFVKSEPKVVERRAEPASTPAPTPADPAVNDEKKRSTTEEVLIVGGSAGAGAAIGAAAGGKKGAAVGAITGGVAGLIYDLATRDKK